LPRLLLTSCHNVKEIDLNLTFPVKSENPYTPSEAVLAGGRRQEAEGNYDSCPRATTKGSKG